MLSPGKFTGEGKFTDDFDTPWGEIEAPMFSRFDFATYGDKQFEKDMHVCAVADHTGTIPSQPQTDLYPRSAVPAIMV